jgi:hypothetical protein
MCERLLETFPQLRGSLVSGRRETREGGVFNGSFVNIFARDQGDMPYLSA